MVWFLVSLILLGLSACSPKTIDIPGRLFFINNYGICDENPISVFELKTGMKSPEQLWTNLPCNKTGFSSILVSQDNKFALLISDSLPNRLVQLNLSTGETKIILLPDFETPKPIELKGALSPNNRYFVFSEYNPVDFWIKPRVYLIDLALGSNSILFESPCAPYGNLGDKNGTIVCASIGLPQWIDNETIIFSSYSDDLPKTVEWGADIDPNRTFVMDLNGNILQEITPALYIAEIAGPTMLYYEYDKGNEGYKWIETSEVKQGVINPHLLNVNSQFRNNNIGDPGYLEIPNISPDGQFALQRIDGVWHLIGLRDGTDIVTPISREHCGRWSPDQKFIWCGDSGSEIISLESFKSTKLIFPQTFWPFAWLP